MVSRREFLELSLASAAGLALRNVRLPHDLSAVSQQLPALDMGLVDQEPMEAEEIPKYQDALPHFAGARVKSSNVTVKMKEFQQFILPASMYTGDPENPPPGRVDPTKGTYVWGYEINGNGPLYPGFTVEARRGIRNRMKYVNELPLHPVLQHYLPYDQTLHWAAPLGMDMTDMDPYMGPPPAVVHLHGGEVPSSYDGGPDQWFTPNGLHGKGYRSAYGTARNAAVYEYPNRQEPTTLWFHDHTLGATRLNVYAGLAAFYILRGSWDDGQPGPGKLPAGPYEIELALQDRMFDTNGQWYFPHESDNPDVHPFWVPEFFGDVMVVNGKSWPYLEVEPRRYRFHMLDGCNARFLSMQLRNLENGNSGPSIWVIGSDGGMLDRPVRIGGELLMAPGERYDVIVDFAGFAGQTLTLTNTANAPFPDGDAVDPNTTGQIMQFRVGGSLTGGQDTSFNPERRPILRMPIVRLVDPSKGTLAKKVQTAVTRQLTLNEIASDAGPLEVVVNNTKWTGKRADGTPIPGSQKDELGDWVTELPRVGTTEVWEIVNLTMDAHPIHLHLTQFQLINREPFDQDSYEEEAYFPAFPECEFIPEYGPPRNYSHPNEGGKLGGNPDVAPYLRGNPRRPLPNETGWKDTVIMYPGEVTRIAVRFTPQDVPLALNKPGANMYPFDPTRGPGYVWHCHIVDHEDNEMMRPYHPVR